MTDAKGEAFASTAGARGTTGNYTHGGDTEKVFHRENADIGAEEAWSTNMKRTYDLHQSHDFETANMFRNLALQCLQNSVETANMVAKKTVERGDLAVDRQWNIDEVSDLSAKSGLQADAIATTLIAAVADILKQKAGS